MENKDLQGVREKPFRIGDTVKVRDCAHVYRLPAGLPQNSMVKVTGRDIGCVMVEHDGKGYEVPLACVDNGQEYLIRGRWGPKPK